jgi:hypothetical protein
VASDCVNAVASIHGEAYGPIVLEIKRPGRKASQQWSLFMKADAPIFDAHCLARSSVNLLVGRHVWFVAPLMEFVLAILMNKEG